MSVIRTRCWFNVLLSWIGLLTSFPTLVSTTVKSPPMLFLSYGWWIEIWETWPRIQPPSVRFSFLSSPLLSFVSFLLSAPRISSSLPLRIRILQCACCWNHVTEFTKKNSTKNLQPSARIFSTKANWRRLFKPELQILNFFVPWGDLPWTIINVLSSTAGWYSMKLRRDIKSLWQELELQSSMREVWSQNPKANEVFEAKRALEDVFFFSFHLLRSLRMFFYSHFCEFWGWLFAVWLQVVGSKMNIWEEQGRRESDLFESYKPNPIHSGMQIGWYFSSEFFWSLKLENGSWRMPWPWIKILGQGKSWRMYRFQCLTLVWCLWTAHFSALPQLR